VTDDLTLFGRYGHQLKGKVRFDRALTVGAELAGTPWGRSADSIGLAFGSLRTSATSAATRHRRCGRRRPCPISASRPEGIEKLTELYYRFKLNSNIELSPELPVDPHPGGNAAATTVKVFGLRAKLGF
jgi:high affinity Mn2+ porin